MLAVSGTSGTSGSVPNYALSWSASLLSSILPVLSLRCPEYFTSGPVTSLSCLLYFQSCHYVVLNTVLPVLSLCCPVYCSSSPVTMLSWILYFRSCRSVVLSTVLPVLSRRCPASLLTVSLVSFVLPVQHSSSSTFSYVHPVLHIVILSCISWLPTYAPNCPPPLMSCTHPVLHTPHRSCIHPVLPLCCSGYLLTKQKLCEKQRKYFKNDAKSYEPSESVRL